MRKRLLAGGLAALMSALLLVPGFGASAAAEQPVNAMAPYEAFVDPVLPFLRGGRRVVRTNERTDVVRTTVVRYLPDPDDVP